MKKYLNDKNLNFVAHLATNFDNGFNLRNAVELCIDEWYLGNPIDEHPEFGGVARNQFNRSLLGKQYNEYGNTDVSEIMVSALGEFFKEYIGPKYHLIQKVTYKYLDYLKSKSLENIYTSEYFTPWSFKEYKDDHSFQILCLVKGTITDWKFGFDDMDDEFDDYYTFEFEDDFNIDDIIENANNDNEEEDIEEINIVCDYIDNTKVEKMPVNTSVKKTTKKKATTNKKKTTSTKKAAKKTK